MTSCIYSLGCSRCAVVSLRSFSFESDRFAFTCHSNKSCSRWRVCIVRRHLRKQKSENRTGQILRTIDIDCYRKHWRKRGRIRVWAILMSVANAEPRRKSSSSNGERHYTRERTVSRHGLFQRISGIDGIQIAANSNPKELCQARTTGWNNPCYRLTTTDGLLFSTRIHCLVCHAQQRDLDRRHWFVSYVLFLFCCCIS